MGPSFSVLNIVCFVGILIYLWHYFGFVTFDLAKFKPVSAVSRVWSMILAAGFPLLGLLSSFKDETRKTLVGIGIATMLVPAIVPDLEAPESDSLMERIYFRTVGKWVVNFFESAVVSLLLLVCWVFGPYWVAAYAGVAFLFAVSRSMWVRVRVQETGHPAEAAPSVGRLLMMFAAAFGWIVFLTAVMPWTELTRKEVNSELGELFMPFVRITGINWILIRFPRLIFLRWFLLKSGD